MYAVTGVSPLTKPTDFGVVTKGEMRRPVAEQYRARMRRNPSRLNMLSEEFDNLGLTAMHLGYSPQWLTPELTKVWESRQGGGEKDILAAGGSLLSAESQLSFPVAAKDSVPQLVDNKLPERVSPARWRAKARSQG